MKKNFLGIIVTVIIAICLLSLTALADTTVNTADGDITISTDNNGNKLVNGTTYTGVLTITGEKRANATIESGTHDIVISDAYLKAFYVVSGSKVNLTIKGQNKMGNIRIAKENFCIEEGAEVIITDKSTGTLDANGMYGINVVGKLIINGGTITAKSDGPYAGIYVKTPGELIINAGNVTSTGGSRGGPGIGGSSNESGGNVTINGGFVTATSNKYGGAGIGGGMGVNGRYFTSAYNVTINGGTVIAVGNEGGEAIGGGEYRSDSSDIVFSPKYGCKVIVRESEDGEIIAEYTKETDVTQDIKDKSTLYITVMPCESFDEKGFCELCGGYEPATMNDDGFYEIENAGQLFWFAELVNVHGDTDACAILKADIDLENKAWYSIGVYMDAVDASGEVKTVQYVGTFDGNNHTVSNFMAHGYGSQGLLGYCGAAAVVKNVGIIGADVKGWNAGAVIAYGGTAENCYAVDCSITAYTTTNANGVYAGSISGAQDPVVKNCFAYNCSVNVGEGNTTPIVTLSPIGGKTTTNCYYYNVSTNGEFRQNDAGIMATAEQVASGEIAYKLGAAFGQDLSDENSIPVLGGKRVYVASLCPAYTNTEGAVKQHEAINGFCKICGDYEPATMNDNGFYEIENAGQLFWFAKQVNEVGNREIKGILTDDIDLEDRPWTPIGTTGEGNNNFRGVFDGYGHTIRGLNVTGTKSGVGFFGEVRTGTVKNFTIYGEVTVPANYTYVGGVVGSACGVNVENDLERNGAIIQNITSYVNLITTAHGVGRVGGFVGYANHWTLIENCTWYGTFDLGEYRAEAGVGGFIGRIQENSESTIRNCAAYGKVKTNYKKGSYNNCNDIFIGGFSGWSVPGSASRPTKTVIENCLFAGSIEVGKDITDMADYSAFGCLGEIKSITNCYFLGENSLLGVNNNSTYKPKENEVAIVDMSQLVSGEVAYKFGSAWGQDLSDDNALPVPGGMAVYKVYLCDGTTETYSNSNENKPHIDENSNCECDVCETALEHVDEDKDCKCDLCEQTAHTDNDNTCICDNCKTQLQHVNINEDFVCDICNGSLIEKTEIKGYDKELKKVTIAYSAPCSYTIIYIDYDGKKLNCIKMFARTLAEPMEDTFIIPSEISLGKDDKIMVLDYDSLTPLCEELIIG